MEKGIFPVSLYDCRVRLLMPKQFGAVSLPRFAVDDNEFHCLNFVLITLLLLGKQTHIQSVATIVVCKGKRRTTLNNATQKSKDIEGREEKLVC